MALRGRQSCWVESGLQIQKRGRTWAVGPMVFPPCARASGGLRAVSCLKRRAVWCAIAGRTPACQPSEGLLGHTVGSILLAAMAITNVTYSSVAECICLALVACDPSHEGGGGGRRTWCEIPARSE